MRNFRGSFRAAGVFYKFTGKLEASRRRRKRHRNGRQDFSVCLFYAYMQKWHVVTRLSV